MAPFVPEPFDEAEKQSSKGGHDDHLVSAHAVFSPVRKGILNVGMSLGNVRISNALVAL